MVREEEGEGPCGFSNTLVDLARSARRSGLRLAVSSQRAVCLSPALLECCTAAVLHGCPSVVARAHLGAAFSLQRCRSPAAASG